MTKLMDISRMSTEQLEELLGITLQQKLDARFPNSIAEEMVHHEGTRYIKQADGSWAEYLDPPISVEEKQLFDLLEVAHPRVPSGYRVQLGVITLEKQFLFLYKWYDAKAQKYRKAWQPFWVTV